MLYFRCYIFIYVVYIYMYFAYMYIFRYIRAFLKTHGSYSPLSLKMHPHTGTQTFSHNSKKLRSGISNIYVLHIENNLEGYS